MGQKKRKQKWLYFLLALLSMVTLCACNPKVQSEPQNSVLGYAEMGESYCSTGAFFFDSNMLHFYDIQSGMDVLICDKADCPHERRSECSAFFDALIMQAAIEDDHLLCVTDYGKNKVGDLFLYEMSVNGENRREIAAFEKMQSLIRTTFYEDKIVISYCNDYDENLEPLPASEAGIYVYDRKTGTGEKVWKQEKWNARIPGFFYYEGMVYFNSLYSDLTQAEVVQHADDRDYYEGHMHYDFCKLELSTGEVEVISADTDVFFGTPSLCGSSLFYNKDGNLYAYDIKTEKAEKVGTEKRQVPSFLDGQAVFRSIDGTEHILYLGNGKFKSLGMKENFTPMAVFPEVTYAYNYATENGYGELVYLKTEDFLKGKLDKWKTFEE